MPLHDWTRVNAGLFHHFHQMWCCEISRVLNRGSLPDGFTALVEQRSGTKEMDLLAIEHRATSGSTAGNGVGLAVREKPQAKHVRRAEKEYYADKASRIVIRHQLGQIVAFIEIVSPGNKHDLHACEEFCGKIVAALRTRVHVLVVDLFPPTPRDPSGIHNVIWQHFDDDATLELTAPQNRCLASYEADGVTTEYIETVAVGDPLPNMPLFIEPGVHVPVPIEGSYMQSWMDTPKAVQRLVE